MWPMVCGIIYTYIKYRYRENGYMDSGGIYGIMDNASCHQLVFEGIFLLGGLWLMLMDRESGFGTKQ